MLQEYKITPATIDDAIEIARLIAISSDGVSTIEWHEQGIKEACDPLNIAVTGQVLGRRIWLKSRPGRKGIAACHWWHLNKTKALYACMKDWVTGW